MLQLSAAEQGQANIMMLASYGNMVATQLAVSHSRNNLKSVFKLHLRWGFLSAADHSVLRQRGPAPPTPSRCLGSRSTRCLSRATCRAPPPPRPRLGKNPPPAPPHPSKELPARAAALLTDLNLPTLPIPLVAQPTYSPPLNLFHSLLVSVSFRCHFDPSGRQRQLSFQSQQKCFE